MTITEQIEGFTEFARRLAAQHGDQLTLDDIFRQWKEVDPAEIAVLRERLASYDAGERGVPVDEFLAARRAARAEGGK
ncbi:MAG: hypothetical protein AAGA92_04110 [Planctomycetota bacterium]